MGGVPPSPERLERIAARRAIAGEAVPCARPSPAGRSSEPTANQCENRANLITHPLVRLTTPGHTQALQSVAVHMRQTAVLDTDGRVVGPSGPTRATVLVQDDRSIH